MTIKISNEIAMTLLKQLGIDSRLVADVTVYLKPNEAPVVEVTRLINEAESNQFLLDLKRYNLEAREVKK